MSVEIPHLSGFVQRALRGGECASIRLREGNDKARCKQRARIRIDSDTTPATLTREITERVAGIASTETVHIEAMTAADSEVLDTTTAYPTRALPTVEEKPDQVMSRTVERMSLDANERFNQLSYTIADHNRQMLEQEKRHHKRIRKLEAYILLLEAQLQSDKPTMDPVKAHALQELINVAGTATKMLGLKMMAQSPPKAIEGPQQAPQAPPSDAPPQDDPNGPNDSVVSAASSTVHNPDDTNVETIVAGIQHTILGLADTVDADAAADVLINTIIAMMPRHKDAFTTERLMRLLPHLDMGAIMGAVMGAQ